MITGTTKIIICCFSLIPSAVSFECGWTQRLAKSNSNQFDEIDYELIPEKKINNGRPAIRIENYPFVVKVGWNIEGESHYCSGSIYDRKTILTAGHCTDRVFNYLRNSSKVEKNYTMFVRVASSNISWDEGITINVKKVFKYPDFARDQGHNGYDIGLVRLEKKLKWSTKVQPICLPLPGNTTESIDMESEVKIAGFGTNSDDMEDPDTLYVGTMTPSMDIGEYGNQFLTEGVIGLLRNSKSQVCAGDSGGPVFQLRNGRFYQFGITVGGAPCEGGNEAVMTSTEYFNQWIIDTVGEPRY